jgi:hypothetical protein
MKFFRKLGHKLNSVGKFGLKLSHKAGVGMRKVSNAVKRYAPQVEAIANKVGNVASALGQPEIAGFARGVGQAANMASRAAPIVGKAGQGLEKISKKKFKQGGEELYGAGKDAVRFK